MRVAANASTQVRKKPSSSPSTRRASEKVASRERSVYTAVLISAAACSDRPVICESQSSGI